jgi:excisionase family DNA binding protein
MFIEEKWWLQLQRRGEEQRRRGMSDINNIPQLLTIDQLAERLGITVRHVRRLVVEKRVPYLKVGRLVRFDPSEIAKWLRDSAPTRPPPGRTAPPGTLRYCGAPARQFAKALRTLEQ